MSVKKKEPNYRALFVVGLSFTGAGLSLDPSDKTAFDNNWNQILDGDQIIIEKSNSM